MKNIEFIVENLIKNKRNDINKENQILNKIIDFCKYLAQFEYNCVDINKNILTNFRENFDKHITLSSSEFVKCNGGICYDYVNYETSKFNSFGVKFKTFFNGYYKNGIAEFTHTYLLFYLNDKIYWFECSWKTNMGIFEFENEDDALSYIIKLQKNNYDESVVQYTPNTSLIGISIGHFINKMNKLPEYNFKYNPNARCKYLYKISVNYNGQKLTIKDKKYL